MFACFEKKMDEIETNEAKVKGETKEELHRKNLDNSAKFGVSFPLLLRSINNLRYF